MTATLKRIALTLARSKDFPNGSSQIGYDLIAPLDSDGHIDLPEWKKHRAACAAHRVARAKLGITGLGRLVVPGQQGNCQNRADRRRP